ncbi:hypothetical protein [Vagococcus sp.]|uniref:hypothetical protein n=1 Tax=Vagococcus sp. TaxID=1933889 RepID=UPI003F9C360A
MTREIVMIFVFLSLSLIASFSAYFEDKKRKEYQNDERWQQITMKANTFTLYFIMCLSLVMFLLGLFAYFGLTSNSNLINQWNGSQFGATFMLGWLISQPFIIFITRIYLLFKYDKEL